MVKAFDKRQQEFCWTVAGDRQLTGSQVAPIPALRPRVLKAVTGAEHAAGGEVAQSQRPWYRDPIWARDWC